MQQYDEDKLQIYRNTKKNPSPVQGVGSALHLFIYLFIHSSISEFEPPFIFITWYICDASSHQDNISFNILSFLLYSIRKYNIIIP